MPQATHLNIFRKTVDNTDNFQQGYDILFILFLMAMEESHDYGIPLYLRLSMIWCEVMNHVKYLGKERTNDVLLSFHMSKKENDREINEWYNEEKSGRQIGICEGEI